jgi:hypothetical protein
MSAETLTGLVLVAVLSFFAVASLSGTSPPPYQKRKSKFNESWSIALYLTSGLCFYITIAASVLAAVLTIKK